MHLKMYFIIRFSGHSWAGSTVPGVFVAAADGARRKPKPHGGTRRPRARHRVTVEIVFLLLKVQLKGNGPLKTTTVTVFRGVCDRQK